MVNMLPSQNTSKAPENLAQQSNMELDSTAALLSQRLDEIVRKITDQVTEQVTKQVTERVTEGITEQLKLMESKMNTRMDERFADLEKRQDAKMDQRFVELEKRQDAKMDQRFSDLVQCQDDKMKQQFLAMEQRLAENFGMTKRWSSMNEDLDRLEGRQATYHRYQTDIDKRVKVVEGSLANLTINENAR